MSSPNPKLKRFMCRGLKFAVLTLTFSALAFGALVVDKATEKRQARGEVTLEICANDGSGGWRVIDRVKAPLNFELSLGQAAAGKVVNINHQWNARSEQGCQGTATWERPSDLSWDLKSGKLELVTPYVLNLNGHRIVIPISCTTESISTPIGTLSGKRAAVNGQTLSASLVGVGRFKAPHNLFQCATRERKRGEDANEEFVVVFRGEGSATLVD